MQKNTSDQAPIPQLSLTHIDDLQIKAMSEFIGRNVLVNHVLDSLGPEVDPIADIEISALPIYDVETRFPMNIEEVKERRDQLLDQKKIEPMTGAFRREELYAQYPNGFKENETVLAVDVAGLKLLNDFYGGHNTGDEALKSAVASIARLIPGVKSFRMGGDEFVFVTDSEVDNELWDKINKTYLKALNEATGKNIPKDKSYLRAGIINTGETEGTTPDAFPSTDDVITAADQAEVRVKALIEILGTDHGVPLIASPEAIEEWLSDNKLELVEKEDKIVAYKTWGPGKRSMLPKYLMRKGSTRVRGRS